MSCSSSQFTLVSGLSNKTSLNKSNHRNLRAETNFKITRLHALATLQFNNYRERTYSAKHYSSSTYSDPLVFRYRIQDRFGL